MAKINLFYPAYATLEAVAKTGVIGKAITANVSISSSDVKLFGDGGVAETDKSFQNGTIDLTSTDLSFQNQADLLGKTLTEDELVSKDTDIAPYVKFGFIGANKVNNAVKYRAVILSKVQFGEPSDENDTKGETIEFKTHSLQGSVLVADDGEWKREKTFATLELAKAYINTELGISSGE